MKPCHSLYPLPLSVALLLTSSVALGEITTHTQADKPKLESLLPNVPALQAIRSQAEAAMARLDSSARFPDPQTELMAANKNTHENSMSMWGVSISQPLPKSGERAADRLRAQSLVDRALAEYAITAGETAAMASDALAEAQSADERTALLTRQLKRTEKILTSIDTRLATGGAKLTERLTIETRLSIMHLMIEREQRMAQDALGDARTTLGLSADSPLPAYQAPSTAELNPDAIPQLQMTSARTDEARAMALMARSSAKPMTAVGLRFERERESMGNADTIGIAFMTEIPWRSRRYARAEETAARSEEKASIAESRSYQDSSRNAIARVERAERLAATARRLSDETTHRLDAEYDTLLNATAASTSTIMNNETTLLMVLDILERQTDAELQVVEADAAVRAARAQLWRYAPASRFSPHKNLKTN